MDPSETQNLAKFAIRSSQRNWWESPLWLWCFQGAIASSVLLITGYLVLWSDAHNDTRYVQKTDNQKDWSSFVERYKDNRDNDRKDRDSIRAAAVQDKSDLKERLDRTQALLDVMANDIKTLLSNNHNKN